MQASSSRRGAVWWAVRASRRASRARRTARAKRSMVLAWPYIRIFVGFDVLVTGNGSRFLDFSQAREQALRAGLRFAEPLHTGSLASCVDFDFRFNSRLPALLGLPPLEKPNHAEGVVIRPQTEPTKTGRQLLKRKIPEFSEKQYRLDDWRINRQAGGGGGGCAADAESMLRFEMLACLTSQRVDAAVSKLGRVEPTDRARCRALLNELIADVHATLVEDGLLTAATGEVDDAPRFLLYATRSCKRYSRKRRVSSSRHGCARPWKPAAVWAWRRFR